MSQPINWKDALSDLKQQASYKKITDFVNSERANGKIIYPQASQVFRALKETSYENVKVVIIGQDPYHGPNQANGLCFSVNHGEKLPPSLRNIYKEIEQDLSITMPTHGDLTSWAQQGVLLLNTVLTVEASQAASHAKKGWEFVTDTIIESLNQKSEPVIFLLWGAHAQQKSKLISKHHHLLKAPHPSPLSAHRGFFGCGHFSKTNQLLVEAGQSPIIWQLTAENK